MEGKAKGRQQSKAIARSSACAHRLLAPFSCRNPDFSKVDLDYLRDPAHCPVHNGRGRTLAENAESKFSLDAFFAETTTWLAAGTATSLILGWLFLQAFRCCSRAMTHATIVSQVAAPLLAGLALLAGGAFAPSMGAFAVAGLAGLAFFWWRNEIGLAANLLSVSAHGLVANPHLITTALLMSLASLAALVPLLAAGFLALLNGEVVPNPARHGSARCVSPQGEPVLCCSWGTDPWVTPYLVAAALTGLWVALTANQIRVFVVSGAISQWYFAPPSPSLSASVRGTTCRSLRHAFGPSFGSLSLAGLIMAAVETVKEASDRAAREPDAGVLATVLSFCAQCIGGAIEYLTKFATVFMAITGDAFFAAGRRVTDLLARNMLEAFASTIWFTPMVVHLASFCTAAVWGLLGGGAYFFTHRHEQHPGANDAAVTATVLGSLIALFALFVLNFLAGVLLGVLDATFVCWALDRDMHTVSHPEVYDVFAAVPLPGAVVQQPGGGVAYAALGQAGAPPQSQHVARG